MDNLVGCSSIHEVIENSKLLDISYEKLFFKSKIEVNNETNLIINYNSLVDNYMEDIMKTCMLVTLTDKDLADYKFQPKKLSYYLYNTTELWFLLLRVNNMVSSLDFNKKKIYIFNKNKIFKVINEIMTLENESYLQANKNSLN